MLPSKFCNSTIVLNIFYIITRKFAFIFIFFIATLGVNIFKSQVYYANTKIFLYFDQSKLIFCKTQFPSLNLFREKA